METMTKEPSSSQTALKRVRAISGTIKKSFNLLIAVGGLVLFVFAGTVLASSGHNVWAGLIGISGLLVFVMGLSGFLVYKLLSNYF